MEDGRIPKAVLYGELVSAARRVGLPTLLFGDTCKRDIKCAPTSIESWESAAVDGNIWRQAVRSGIRKAEETRNELWIEKRERRRKVPLAYHDSTTNCVYIKVKNTMTELRLSRVAGLLGLISYICLHHFASDLGTFRFFYFAHHRYRLTSGTMLP